MEPAALIERLASHGVQITAAFESVTNAEVRWRPKPTRWSAIEILGHLVDEETRDFRVRIAATLEGAEGWKPIDPEGWVRERDHQNADADELLRTFERERAASLDWLGSLGEVDWSATYRHPQLGEISAGDLLASWVMHDQLHLAQLARTRAEWLREHATPWSTHYAAP